MNYQGVSLWLGMKWWHIQSRDSERITSTVCVNCKLALSAAEGSSYFFSIPHCHRAARIYVSGNSAFHSARAISGLPIGHQCHLAFPCEQKGWVLSLYWSNALFCIHCFFWMENLICKLMRSDNSEKKKKTGIIAWCRGAKYFLQDSRITLWYTLNF